MNDPVINKLDKVDTYYTQDKWRINFGFINSLHLWESSAEALVTLLQLWAAGSVPRVRSLTSLQRDEDLLWRPCWRPPVRPSAPGQRSARRWRPCWPGCSESWECLRRVSAPPRACWCTPGSSRWNGTASWAAGTSAPAAATRSRSASPPGWRCRRCSSASARWTGPGICRCFACTASCTRAWMRLAETSPSCPAASGKTLRREGKQRKQLNQQAVIYGTESTILRFLCPDIQLYKGKEALGIHNSAAGGRKMGHNDYEWLM